jgi:hypothetical protein
MSKYTEGQVHQLADALEAAGYTKGDLTTLGQFPNHQLFLGVLRGTHEIKAKELLSFRVIVDRSLSPQQALEATGRRQHVDDTVVETMPRGSQDTEEVFFVKRDKETTDEEWDEHLDFMGLKPCDPFTLAKYNADNPDAGDNRPNGTHWKDAAGKRCFASFSRWEDERELYVSRSEYGWNDDWWFAGVRK